jgi:hypothetical protein
VILAGKNARANRDLSRLYHVTVRSLLFRPWFFNHVFELAWRHSALFTVLAMS